MEFHISDLLNRRIQITSQKDISIDYNKKWNEAVKCFQEIINKERAKDNLKPLSFIVIRQKLVVLREIDDMRWFYKECLKYKYKKKGNTFGKCFFGSLKIK